MNALVKDFTVRLNSDNPTFILSADVVIFFCPNLVIRHRSGSCASEAPSRASGPHASHRIRKASDAFVLVFNHLAVRETKATRGFRVVRDGRHAVRNRRVCACDEVKEKGDCR